MKKIAVEPKTMVRLKAKKIKTENQIDTIGERLRKARQDKGISLEKAHRITKIHPNVLEALEEDRLENILGKAYFKVFLKNYAHYLGFDAKEVIQQYLSKHAPETYEKPVLEQRPISQKKARKFSHAIIVASTFIVWLLILSFATVKFVHRYKKVTTSKKAELREKAEKFPPKRSADSPLAKDIKTKLIPIPKSRTIALTIVTSRDVWLKLIQDGELAFHAILSKNSKETWRADKEIRLSEIGRPEALKLNVNGKDIDLSGRRLGKGILITHEGIDLEPKL